MTTNNRKEWRSLATGLAFLAPNILGFLCFTLIPLLISLMLAFSNWDLKLHNMFRSDDIRFVGFDNFLRLFRSPDFGHYLGNTLFLMLGMPFAIAGSLVAALLLNGDLRGKSRREWRVILAGAGLLVSVVLLTITGLQYSALTMVLCGLGALILAGGILGGNTVYRTIFYLPYFTSGVAVFLLWKKLYNPQTGPVNVVLAPPLETLEAAVKAVPQEYGTWAAALCSIIMGALSLWLLVRLGRMLREGELGIGAVVIGLAMLAAFMDISYSWLAWSPAFWIGASFTVVGLLCCVAINRKTPFRNALCPHWKGVVDVILLLAGILALELILLGLGNVACHLPGWAREESGLQPPNWLTDYYWAKPAIMIMGLWGAIGSNNMLLYLAGLSNIPQDLYDAADIDGASVTQRFWHITWPQLAPVTFFVVVMGIIGGLQGGFEMARAMTKGGPAGSTTTLSYYVYTEGFETGQLGFASAVAWVLFALVFSVTIFNWKFGSRYVND